jgi:ribosomal protein S18 acetylase RimI-like enzyme
VIITRQLFIHESHIAAKLHRRGGALIPGYDLSLHTPEEDMIFYRDHVMKTCVVWGAFDGEHLRGHIAFRPGWVDHLYVDPNFLRLGIGSKLMQIAKSQQSELRLFTFQSNTRARTFYEMQNFAIEALSDGAGNEEKLPDVTYLWRRAH